MTTWLRVYTMCEKIQLKVVAMTKPEFGFDLFFSFFLSLRIREWAIKKRLSASILHQGKQKETMRHEWVNT